MRRAVVALGVAALVIACGGSYESQETPVGSDAGGDATTTIVESPKDGSVGTPPDAGAVDASTDAALIHDASADANDDAATDAGPTPGDTTPLPNACGAGKVPCTAAACASACFSVAHVPTAGDLVMATGLEASSKLSSNVVGNTATGALGKRRANSDPTKYEIWNGIGFQLVPQGGAKPSLAVWTFVDLSIEAGTWTFTGNGAVVLLARTSLTLASGAVIDVSAHGLNPGPGGSLGGGYRAAGDGCGGGAPSSGDNSGANGGGGGGGFGAKGGAGGAGSAAGGVGGGACNPTYLTGGSGGAGGDDGSGATGRFGGAGGGAIQLSSANAIAILGTVVAGGGAGRTAAGNFRHGAGAGSGGMIYIEGVATTGAGTGLFANGGGGGSGSPGTGSPCAGALAADGPASTAAANGSHCAHGWGGNGGATGGASVAGVAGEAAATDGAGGGGGGVGRIVLASARAASPAPKGSASPDPTLGTMAP